MNANEFTCDHCGGTFEKGWSEEEARAEAGELWTEQEQAEGMAVICDDCFKQFVAWMRSEAPVEGEPAW